LTLETHLGFELPSPRKQNPKNRKNKKTKKRVLQVQKKAAGFVCRQSKPMMSSSLKQPEAKRHHTERLFRDEIEARASLSRTRHAGKV
jgi:hypothetical protein